MNEGAVLVGRVLIASNGVLMISITQSPFIMTKNAVLRAAYAWHPEFDLLGRPRCCPLCRIRHIETQQGQGHDQ